MIRLTEKKLKKIINVEKKIFQEVYPDMKGPIGLFAEKIKFEIKIQGGGE